MKTLPSGEGYAYALHLAATKGWTYLLIRSDKFQNVGKVGETESLWEFEEFEGKGDCVIEEKNQIIVTRSVSFIFVNGYARQLSKRITLEHLPDYTGDNKHVKGNTDGLI